MDVLGGAGGIDADGWLMCRRGRTPWCQPWMSAWPWWVNRLLVMAHQDVASGVSAVLVARDAVRCCRMRTDGVVGVEQCDMALL